MTDTERQAMEKLAAEASDDVKLGLKIAQAYKTGGKAAALALLPEVVAEVKEDMAAVKSALPVVKEGYKTTEFWLTLAVLAINAYKPLPLEVNSVIGSLVAVYAVIRGLVKKPTT